MIFFEFINKSSSFIILGLVIFSIILLILCIVALRKSSNVKKRVSQFMGDKNGGDFEDMLKSFIDRSNAIDERHSRIINDIRAIQRQIKFCIQKIGIVRYNPFEDVGGDLCSAVAILDQNNDGFVLNSVYSRDGCYTYAKPIEKGKCPKYKLSGEEEEAVIQAVKCEKKEEE